MFLCLYFLFNNFITYDNNSGFGWFTCDDVRCVMCCNIQKTRKRWNKVKEEKNRHDDMNFLFQFQSWTDYLCGIMWVEVDHQILKFHIHLMNVIEIYPWPWRHAACVFFLPLKMAKIGVFLCGSEHAKFCCSSRVRSRSSNKCVFFNSNEMRVNSIAPRDDAIIAQSYFVSCYLQSVAALKFETKDIFEIWEMYAPPTSEIWIFLFFSQLCSIQKKVPREIFLSMENEKNKK